EKNTKPPHPPPPPKITTAPCRRQRRCRIDHHNIARGPGLVIQNPPDERGIFHGSSYANRFQRVARHAEFFRRQRESFHSAAAYLGHQRLARERNLVQSAFAVHNKRALDTKFRQRYRQQIDHISRKNAEYLRL